MRVGHVYRIPDLLQAVSDNPSYVLWTNRPLDDWDGIPLASMMAATRNAGFVSCSEDGRFQLTASGKLVIAEKTPRTRFRRTTMELYSHTKPPWTSVTPQGRQAVRVSAPPDDLQCLEESGLLDDSDRDTVAWWDALACGIRAEQDQRHLEIGRDAEDLTIGYESWRTGTVPLWVALESTLAGYDVLSRVSSGDPSTLVIEVKGSTRPLSAAVFTLTRNEWNVLEDSLRSALDAWLLNDHQATLHRIDVRSLSTLIPVDQGGSKWQTVTVPYSALPAPCTRATWIGTADGRYDYHNGPAE